MLTGMGIKMSGTTRYQVQTGTCKLKRCETCNIIECVSFWSYCFRPGPFQSDFCKESFQLSWGGSLWANFNGGSFGTNFRGESFDF